MKNLIITLLTILLTTAAFADPAPQKEQSKVNSPSYEFNEKGVAAVKSQNFKEAEELFRKALAADPKNMTAVFNLAGMYLTNKKDDVAVSLLNDYVKQNPKDPGLFVRLGDAYFASKNIKDAAANYEKALTLAPNYIGVSAKLGTLYGLMNRIEDAEKMYLKAVEQNPKDVQILSNLSNIFLANRKAQEAVSTAKLALQIKASPELYVTLGNAYELLNDSQNSLISYERAVDLGDSSADTKSKIESLKKAKS